MFIYLAILIIGYWAINIPNKYKVVLLKFYIIFLAFFLCFGYTTGSDWRVYEVVYNEMDISSPNFFFPFEPGYMLYMYLAKLLGIEFWPFFCFTKVVLWIIISSFLIAYQKKEGFFVITFFVGLFGYMLFIDNPMRMLIAIAFYLISVSFFIKGEKRKAYFFVLLSFCFHFSSIVLYIYLNVFTKKIRTRNWIIAFALFSFLLCSKQFLYLSISNLLGFIPYIQAKLESYFLNNDNIEPKVLSVGFIIHIILFIIVLFERSKFECSKFDSLCVNSFLFFVCLYRITFILDIFARFQYFLYPFYVIFLIKLYRISSVKQKLWLGTLMIAISFYFTYTKTTADSRYVPYTNYLIFFIEGNNMSFQERSDYNANNSPYKPL